MQAFFKSAKNLSIRALALGMFLTVPNLAWSNTVDENPGALSMTADALVVRPVMAVGTLLGGVIFVVSSPFSALGGNTGEAWDTLVKQPFRVTFDRCLGCRHIGRETDVVNQ